MGLSDILNGNTKIKIIIKVYVQNHEMIALSGGVFTLLVHTRLHM